MSIISIYQKKMGHSPVPKPVVDHPLERTIEGVDFPSLRFSKKSLVNYFCDGYSEKSPLSGMPFDQTIHQMLNLLDHVKRERGVEIPDELIERYKHLYTFEQAIASHRTKDPNATTDEAIITLAQTIGEHILKLNIGETASIPCGYTTKVSGHAMILDIKRNGNNTFDFVMNTTGDGLQFHDSIQTDDKKMVHVELVFKNIPYDRLFFTPIGEAPSFIFFESLLYPLIVVQDAPFNASFIYKYLLHEFYEFYDTQQYSLNTFQKPQGDGNCLWKILIKHLSIHLPDDVYQRVRFLGDRDLLLQFYKEGDACGDIEAQNIFLICIEKFHARIVAALKIGAISREEGEEAQALATFIQQQVKTYNPMTPVITDIEAPFEVIPDKAHAAACVASLPHFKVDFPVPYGYSVKDPEDTEIPCTPETLVTGLQRVRIYSKKWPLEEGVKLYVIERFIDQIPILDEAFWEKVPECTHEKCLKILSEVMEFYHHKTLITHGYISGKQVDHLLTLYTAIDRLARKIEAKRQNILERFSPFNPLPFLDNEPFLHLSHARETSRYQEARLYFEGYNQSLSIPRLDTVREIIDLNVRKNNFSHFCYEVATRYSSVRVKCENAYCKNLRSVSAQRNATNDLINTYLLIKNRARHFTPETDHLKQWVDAIWRMQTLLSDGPKIESQSVNLNPYKFYINQSWTGFSFFYTNWEKTERYQQYFQPPEEDLRTFFEKSYHKRMFFAEDPSPHEVKTLGESQENISIMPPWASQEIYWASAERELHPFHLLFYFQNHIDQLKTPSYQTTLYLQFFKTLAISDKQTTTENLEIADPALLDVISDFYEKGLYFFHEMQPEKKPDLPTCLFFMRFLQKACASCHAPQEDPRTQRFMNLVDQTYQMIEAWLEIPDLSKSDKSQLHLHRIHYYQSTLRKAPYSSKVLGKILGSWFYFRNNTIEQKRKLPFLEEAMSDFTRVLINGMKEREDIDYNQMVLEIFRALKIEQEKLGLSSEEITWRKSGKYLLEDRDKLDLTLNLLYGEVFSKGRRLAFAIPQDLFHSNGYRRLFGDKQYDFYKVADSMEYDYFDHPQWGTIRVYQHDHHFSIQFFREERWLLYVDREKLCTRTKNAFPRPLILHHHHFVPVKEGNPQFLLIMNEKLELVAQMNPEGKIFELGGSILTRPKKTDEISALFDRPDYQLLRFNHAGIPQDWELPRFHSIHGHPLKFVYRKRIWGWGERKGMWGWGENPYFVITRKRKEFLVGAIPNYYHLCHKETGQEKILIPYHPIVPETTRTFLPSGELDVRKESDVEKQSALDEPEYFTYFSYKVEEDSTLIPESLEGALFLAYLDLHQGKYDSFLNHIASLSPIDNPSPLAFKIIKEILEYPQTYPNTFPQIHALILKLAIPGIEHLRKKDILQDMTAVSVLVEHPYERYLQYLHHINENYQLTPTEEGKILEIFPKGRWRDRENLVLHHTRSQTYTKGEIPSPTEHHELTLWAISDLSGLRGIDVNYQGGLTKSPSFQHIQAFSLDTEFFQRAWDTINSNDLYARNRLRLHLQMMSGILHIVPDSSVSKNLCHSTIQFYLYFLSLPPPLNPYPYPCEFKGEIDEFFKSDVAIKEEWINALHKKAGNTRIPFTVPYRPRLSLPSTPLPPPPASNPVEDTLFLSSLPYKVVFGEIIALFDSKPLIEGKFEDLPEAWGFEVPEHLSRYKKPIAKEIEHTKETLLAGRERLSAMKLYTLPKEKVAECAVLLEKRIAEEQATLEKLEDEILRLAKGVPLEALLPQLLREGANQTNPLSMKRLSQLFLLRSKEAFLRANPYLTSSDLQKLFDLLGEWNYHTVLHNLAILQKKSLKQIERIDGEPPSPDKELAREIFCQTIVTELQNEPQFPADISPEALTFARMTHKIPRDDQIEDVRHFNNEAEENCVLQKVMGGGKTSVDAAIWGYLCAKRGKLPVLVVHNSQKSQVKENLKKSQKTAFEQEVFTIEYLREELTLDRLKYIRNQLIEAQKANREIGKQPPKMLIICPELLDVLDLQCEILLLRLLNLEGSDAPVNLDNAFEKMEVLSEIMDFFQMHTEGLGDEVDLLFNNYQETNVPIGLIKQVPTGRVELARSIFDLLISETVLIEGKSIRDYVGIILNRQTALPTPEYKAKILPVIAHLLVTTQFPSLKGKEHLQDSFVRFVSQTIDPIVDKVRLGLEEEQVLTPSQKLDLEFMRHLHKLYENANAAIKEEANLICLSKHILSDLLPVVFKLSAGRNFGRWRDQGQQIKTPFKVIPFLGVDTPALTEFGHHYEAIVKHFLTVLQYNIEGGQVQLVAEKMLQAAKQQMSSEGIALEKTAESPGFRKLAGIELEEAKSSDKAEEAAAYINTCPHRKLQLEGETTALYATFYESRLTRRPQGLPGFFSKFHVMGGTPWNCDGYNPEYTSNLLLDKAAEGSILQMAMNRVKETPIHIAGEITLEAIFETIYAVHPDNFVEAIFDSGALFSHYKNKDFAVAFMKFAAKKKITFKGCCFFDNSEKEGMQDQFSAIINGFKTPVPIHGTRPRDIEDATNFTIEDFFYLLAEKQTTGTDLVFKPNARAIWTVDGEILLRTILQTLLRERQFFYHQRSEPLIPAYIVPNLVKPEGTLAAILGTSVMNQGIKKANSLDRSYHNMIDQVFIDKHRQARQYVLKQKLGLKQTLTILRTLCEVLSPFIQLHTIDEPFLHFSGLEDDVDYIQSLEHYAQKKLHCFEEQLRQAKAKYDQNPADLKRIQELEADFQSEMKPKILGLVQRAKDLHRDMLPATVKEVPYLDPKSDEEASGIPIAAEIHQERQVEREVERELETDLQRELEGYENLPAGGECVEKRWTDVKALTFITDLLQKGVSSDTMTLNDAFRKVLEYRRNFSFWDENILVTENYRRSRSEALPVFHKFERPAKHILVIHPPDKAPLFILLSTKEGIFFKQWLEQNYKTHPELHFVHLIHATKKPFVLNPQGEEPNSILFERGIVLINLYGGTISSIDSMHLGLAEQWISEICQEEEICTCSQRKQSFLKMRVERNSLERDLFYQSDLLQEEGSVHKYTSLVRMREEIHLGDPRKIPNITDPAKIFRFKMREIEHITPDQVPYIHPNMICYLAKPELIQAVPLAQVHRLTDNQIPLIAPHQISGILKKEKVQRLTEKLLSLKNIEHSVLRKILAMLSPTQLAWLNDPELVPLVANVNLQYLNPSLVPAIDPKHWDHLDPVKQLPHLSTEQLSLVPEDQHPRLIEKCEGLLAKLPLPQLIAIWDRVREGETPLKKHIESLIPKILDSTIIPLIRVNEDLNLLHPSLVNQIPHERLPALHVEILIQNLNPSQIAYIAQEHLGKITPTQLAHHLVNPEIMEIMADAQIASAMARLQIVNPLVIQKMADAQIASVMARLQNDITLQALSPADLIALATYEKPQIHIPARAALKTYSNKDIIPLANTPQLLNELFALVAHIPPKRYEELTAGMIPLLPQTHLYALNEAQMEHLTPLQVGNTFDPRVAPKLPVSKIPYLNQEFINLFIPETIQAIKHETLIQRLPQNQLIHLSEDQVKAIQSNLLIQRLPPEKIPYLNQDQLVHVRQPQMHYLSRQQLLEMINPALIRRLPFQYLEQLSSDQMDHLTQEQIQSIQNRDTLNKLKRPKLRALSERQIQAIRDPNLLGRLHPEQIPFTQIIFSLPDHQIPHLAPAQIPSLAQSKLDLLTPDQLEHVTLIQLQHIENPITIQKLRRNHIEQLSFRQIIHLHIDQFSEATPIQKVAYVISTITLGILALVAKATLTLSLHFAEMVALEVDEEEHALLNKKLHLYIQRLEDLFDRTRDAFQQLYQM